MRTYGKLCTLIYDLDKPFAPADEIKIYTNYINSKQAKILEPMCGSGRFYIPLLMEGYTITGFDSSRDMLNACVRKCLKLKLKPDVFFADITNFVCKEKYDYVFIPIGSLSLLINETELGQSLNQIIECLDEGGVFIFSFLNMTTPVENVTDWQETMRYPVHGMEIICKKKVNYIEESQIINMKLLYELIENGTIIENEIQDFPMKLYSERFLLKKIIDTGFNAAEVIKGSESNEQFSIIKCAKG